MNEAWVVLNGEGILYFAISHNVLILKLESIAKCLCYISQPSIIAFEPSSHPHLVIVRGEAERSVPGVSALAPGHVPLRPVHGLGQRQHQGQQPAGHHCQH